VGSNYSRNEAAAGGKPSTSHAIPPLIRLSFPLRYQQDDL
jgi:hypothetical protein